MLEKTVDELELSVRSGNCLRAAKIRTLGDLVQKSEAEMLQYRNFGKKSLKEIADLLTVMGLHFGMDVSRYLGLRPLPPEPRASRTRTCWTKLDEPLDDETTSSRRGRGERPRPESAGAGSGARRRRYPLAGAGEGIKTMRHRVDHRKLSRTASHRKALLRNLVTALFLHERIETTVAKAKEARRLAERLITFAKRNNLHSRRLWSRPCSGRGRGEARLFDVIAPCTRRARAATRASCRRAAASATPARWRFLELVKTREQKEAERKRKEEAAEAAKPKPKKKARALRARKKKDEAAARRPPRRPRPPRRRDGREKPAAQKKETQKPQHQGRGEGTSWAQAAARRSRTGALAAQDARIPARTVEPTAGAATVTRRAPRTGGTARQGAVIRDAPETRKGQAGASDIPAAAATLLSPFGPLSAFTAATGRFQECETCTEGETPPG